MSEILMRYNGYVHQMWMKNCDERAAWCQPILTKSEYAAEHGTFLEDNFYIVEMGNKVWNGKEYVDPTPLRK